MFNTFLDEQCILFEGYIIVHNYAGIFQRDLTKDELYVCHTLQLIHTHIDGWKRFFMNKFVKLNTIYFVVISRNCTTRDAIPPFLHFSLIHGMLRVRLTGVNTRGNKISHTWPK